MPKKAGGLGQFANLREGLGKKEGVVFLKGADTPIHTMIHPLPNIHMVLSCLIQTVFKYVIIHEKSYMKTMEVAKTKTCVRLLSLPMLFIV